MEHKRCPFCGGEGRLDGGGDSFWIACYDCGVETLELDTPEEAWQEWDQRAEPDIESLSLADELEALHRRFDDFRIEVKMYFAEILGLLRPGVPKDFPWNRSWPEVQNGDDISALIQETNETVGNGVRQISENTVSLPGKIKEEDDGKNNV